MGPATRHLTIAVLAASGAALTVGGCASSAAVVKPRVYPWIPASARVMTLEETQAAGPRLLRPAVTVTSATQVGDIVAAINGLASISPDTVCSGKDSAYAKQIAVTFRAQVGGPVLATAFLSPKISCGLVEVTGNGKETGLGPVGSASGVLLRLRQVTRLGWLPAG